VPLDVDETKIEASFSKGLLTVTLPKRAEAQKLAKTIAVKAA
jgi:HSP20 family protein